MPPQRFGIGHRVECRTGDEEWSAGKIVALDYSEDSWPAGRVVPYQIRLDNGRLIFAPVDIDQVIRSIHLTWWNKVFDDKPGSYFARNPSAHDLRKQCGKKGDVNETDYRGNFALLEAVRCNWLNGTKQLIEMRADPNLANKDQTRPLHLAVVHGVDLIRTLIDAKANPNCQDHDPDYDPDFSSKSFEDRIVHRTPLHYACLEGGSEAVSFLIKSGAELDVQDAQLKTPLHLGIDEGRAGIVKILLKFRADVNLGNIQDGVQTSSLIVASRKGTADLVVALIGARANIDQQGKQDMTALHMAARGGHTVIVQTLLAARANTELKSQSGVTALELARTNCKREVLQVFGCSFNPPEREVKHISSLSASEIADLCLE